MRSENPPQALLEDIVTTVQDPFLGLEALALASLCEAQRTDDQAREASQHSGSGGDARCQSCPRPRVASLLAQLRVLAQPNALVLVEAPAN